MWHHRSLTLTAIASVAGALLTIGVFLLFTANAQQALSSLGDRREVVVYLKDSASNEEVQALRARMESLYGVSTYVASRRPGTSLRASWGATNCSRPWARTRCRPRSGCA